MQEDAVALLPPMGVYAFMVSFTCHVPSLTSSPNLLILWEPHVPPLPRDQTRAHWSVLHQQHLPENSSTENLSIQAGNKTVFLCFYFQIPMPTVIPGIEEWWMNKWKKCSSDPMQQYCFIFVTTYKGNRFIKDHRLWNLFGLSLKKIIKRTREEKKLAQGLKVLYVKRKKQKLF